MHLWPNWLPLHALHSPPLLPQTASRVPVWQVPFIAAEQQPPLHGVVMSHAGPQVCVVMLHAWLAGQSVTLLQPQVLLPPMLTQELPLDLPTQLPHSGCPSAQASEVSPVTQVVPLQQPPLHGWVALHVIVQVPAVVSHAWPFGQSAGPVQPTGPPPSPRSPPTPASSPPPATSVTLTVSQPGASTRGSLVALPSAASPANAVTVIATVWPAG